MTTAKIHQWSNWIIAISIITFMSYTCRWPCFPKHQAISYSLRCLRSFFRSYLFPTNKLSAAFLLLLLSLLFILAKNCEPQMGFKPTLHFWYPLMWLHDPVMSHTRLSWSDYLTAWCCYESHVLVLIWLSDCVMLLWVTRASPDLNYLTAWCCYESHVLVLISIWLCDAVTSHKCLSWSDYLTAWCNYEINVLVLIGLSHCVMQF